MDPITAFLSSKQLPTDKKEAHKLRNKALRYYLDLQGRLYKKNPSLVHIWNVCTLTKSKSFLLKYMKAVVVPIRVDVLWPIEL